MDHALSSGFYVESEFTLPVDPDEVIRVCYEVAESLDLVLDPKPRRRLVLRDHWPLGFAKVDVQVTREGEGSHVFLSLDRPRVPVLRRQVTMQENVAREYQRAYLDRVRRQLEMAFDGPKDQRSLGSGKPAGRQGLRPAPRSVRLLRIGSTLFLFAFCILMFNSIFGERDRGAAYLTVSAWIWLAAIWMDALRRRMLRWLTRDSAFMVVALLVIAVVATSLYYVFR